jgi:radical SAM-linked protein
MALDPPPVARTDAPEHGVPVAARTRLRIRFEKAGDLRFVSHHDLMHCFERMFRRAEVAVRASQGFNPKPRMVFAQSLALGLIGRAEVVELELDEPLSPEEVHKRLAGQAPPGLAILSVRSIDPKTRVQVRRAVYRVGIPVPRRADLPCRIEEILASTACWIERTRPHQRRIDLRPYLCELQLKDDALEMALWVTPYGAARPDEVLGLLGLADLSETGAVIERIHLELHDEVSAVAGDGTGVAGPPPRPVSNHITESAPLATQGSVPESRAEMESPSRPTALIPGPLSFES